MISCNFNNRAHENVNFVKYMIPLIKSRQVRNHEKNPNHKKSKQAVTAFAAANPGAAAGAGAAAGTALSEYFSNKILF